MHSAIHKKNQQPLGPGTDTPAPPPANQRLIFKGHALPGVGIRVAIVTVARCCGTTQETVRCSILLGCRNQSFVSSTLSEKDGFESPPFMFGFTKDKVIQGRAKKRTLPPPPGRVASLVYSLSYADGQFHWPAREDGLSRPSWRQPTSQGHDPCLTPVLYWG